MKIKCIDSSDNCGTGTNLLTEGKIYNSKGVHGVYYILNCDDGKEHTKCKSRFEIVKNS